MPRFRRQLLRMRLRRSLSVQRRRPGRNVLGRYRQRRDDASKPDPQPYLLAAQRLGVEPSRCVALEDSPSGVRSATAAGMKVIVVPGELEVPAELGNARMLHTELTLDAVRALGE